MVVPAKDLADYQRRPSIFSEQPDMLQKNMRDKEVNDEDQVDSEINAY